MPDIFGEQSLSERYLNHVQISFGNTHLTDGIFDTASLLIKNTFYVMSPGQNVTIIGFSYFAKKNTSKPVFPVREYNHWPWHWYPRHPFCQKDQE